MRLLPLGRSPDWSSVTLVAAVLSLFAAGLGVLIPVATDDWRYLEEGSQILSGSAPWDVYAERPDIQVGPVALAMAGLAVGFAGQHAATIVPALIGLSFGPVLLLALNQSQGTPKPRRVAAAGALGLLPWTALSGSSHIDEVLAITLVLGAMKVASRGRSLGAGLLVGLAGGSKPWGVTCVPAVASSSPRDGAWSRVLLGAAVVSLLCWGPFAWGMMQSLRAGYPVAYPVDPATVWEPWRNSEGVLSSWVRVPQLLLSLAAAALVARRDPLTAVAVATAVRIALDPGPWPYQFGALAVVLIAIDATRPASPEGGLFAPIRAVGFTFWCVATMALAGLAPGVATSTALVALAVALARSSGRHGSISN